MRDRKIFVGSSSEALDHAARIRTALQSTDGVDVVLWIDHFDVGDITFVAIEQLASEIVGAVFLATPDDQTRLRGKDGLTPRANVIFEYGFLTASLGRSRVALCRYDDVVLPSDFNGLTTLNMGPFVKEAPQLDEVVAQKLQRWALGLPILPQNVPAAKRVHGVSGSWDVHVRFTKWRGLPIGQDEFIEARGAAHLQVDSDETQRDAGVITGTLVVCLRHCEAEFSICDEIKRASISDDGVLSLHSQTFARQRLKLVGEPPQQEGFEETLRGRSPFDWVLEPDGPGAFRGTYLTERNGQSWSEGYVRLSRK